MDKETARQFILRKQGLIGEYRFIGKDGAAEYVRQAGCIQFDPIDVCGKNAELTLQSRVRDFRKEMLDELLYKDRSLIDITDKELAVIPVENWPYFLVDREKSLQRSRQIEGLSGLEIQAENYIREHGPVNSATLPIDGTISMHSSVHWSGNRDEDLKASRAVLDQMFKEGKLVIHHKAGSRKYYDLSERHLPEEILYAADPCPDKADHIRWRVRNRIGAAGMLRNRRSDAFLGIPMTAEQRDQAFAELLQEGSILPVKVEGIREEFYVLSGDAALLQEVMDAAQDPKPRCEFLAPLDPFLWDRKLIGELFDFQYTWEIYTPAAKRKYGYYVLPILYGSRFVGRIEAVADRKASVLRVKNIWYEEGVRKTKKLEAAVGRTIRRFARFNGCTA